MCSCFCVFQRRRSAEDELAMRGFLQEGDLISVSCTFFLSYRAAAVLALCLARGTVPCRGLGLFSIAQNDALGFVTCEDPMVFSFLL